MTNQEIFDTVVTHLRKQGCKAQSGMLCRYRTATNLKCAAGCLIPDEDYDGCFEHKLVTDLDYFLKRFTSEQIDLICRLQHIHDKNEVVNWEREFKCLAGYFGLKYTELI